MNLQLFGLLLNAPSYLDRYFCFLSLHCSMDRQAAWIQLRGTAQHYSFNGLLLRLPFFVTYTGSPSHISHLFPFLFVILYMYAHNAPLAHYPRPVPLSSESFEPTTFGHGSSEQEVSKLQVLNPPFGHRGFDKPRTHPVSSPAPPLHLSSLSIQIPSSPHLPELNLLSLSNLKMRPHPFPSINTPPF
jgi:hypothetical protein